MDFHPERTAIVGATGPTGFHLARELVSRGREVRVISRRRGHLEEVVQRPLVGLGLVQE
jgi:uncharacterized protein YbjT (DUF2867 family)